VDVGDTGAVTGHLYDSRILHPSSVIETSHGDLILGANLCGKFYLHKILVPQSTLEAKSSGSVII
jgi:hypothetical protein